jgi:hypothetical protein
MSSTVGLINRFKASGIHLILSALIAAITALLVFSLWYPWPYRIVAGGQTLFLLVVSVDLVLGPTLTFIANSPGKLKQVFLRDLAVIVALQFGGLMYGIHAVYVARPVAMVYENARFRVVADVDVIQQELPLAPPQMRELSKHGPVVLGTRLPRDADEQSKAIAIGLAGADIGQRPSFWQPYQQSSSRVLSESRPVSLLLKQYPNGAGEIESAVRASGRNDEGVRFVPILSKRGNWSALVDAKTAEVIGYVPYDGFFKRPHSDMTQSSHTQQPKTGTANS